MYSVESTFIPLFGCIAIPQTPQSFFPAKNNPSTDSFTKANRMQFHRVWCTNLNPIRQRIITYMYSGRILPSEGHIAHVLLDKSSSGKFSGKDRLKSSSQGNTAFQDIKTPSSRNLVRVGTLHDPRSISKGEEGRKALSCEIELTGHSSICITVIVAPLAYPKIDTLFPLVQDEKKSFEEKTVVEGVNDKYEGIVSMLISLLSPEILNHGVGVLKKNRTLESDALYCNVVEPLEKEMNKSLSMLHDYKYSKVQSIVNYLNVLNESGMEVVKAKSPLAMYKEKYPKKVGELTDETRNDAILDWVFKMLNITINCMNEYTKLYKELIVFREVDRRYNSIHRVPIEKYEEGEKKFKSLKAVLRNNFDLIQNKLDSGSLFNEFQQRSKRRYTKLIQERDTQLQYL